MRLNEVDGSAISEAVSAMPLEFQTDDVARHPAVLAAHGPLVLDGGFHETVGRHLSVRRRALGIRSLGRGSNGRGERWQRVHAPAPEFRYGYGRSPGDPATLGERLVRASMVLLPVLFFGLFAWVPPLWAGVKCGDRPRLRRLLLLSAAGLLGMFWLGVALFSLAPTDGDDVPTGPMPLAGFLLLMTATAGGTGIALWQRNAGIDAARREAFQRTPEIQRVLAARQAREQYRELLGRDPALARELRLGRPDLPRSYDDGGLLDLNALPAHALARCAGLRPEQALHVVEVRQQLGRLTSVDDLVVHGELDLDAAERLREYAIFL